MSALKKHYRIVYIQILFLTLPGFAQVGGVSASKLQTATVETIQKNTMEFEPAFVSIFFRKGWDENGNLINLSKNGDSLFVESVFAFRLTFGVGENLEIGAIFPTDASSLSIGAKYRLMEGKNFSYGLLFGLNSPLGNTSYKLYRKSLGMILYNLTIAAGAVMSYQFDEKLSIDTDFQYQRYIEKNIENQFHNYDIFIDLDCGYYFVPDIQAIIGFNYFRLNRDGVKGLNSKLTINTGFTIEKAKNFLIVLNLPYDIYGINTSNTMGFGFAVTMTVD